MKEKILIVIAVVSLILSITAVALEVRYNITQIEPSKIKGTAWTSTNDGSASGLDADKLDTLHSSQFLRKDVSDTINGNLYINGTVLYNSVTHYYTIPSSAFEPNDPRYLYSNSWSILTSNELDYGIGFSAPLNLPDNAQVNNIIVYYFNNDPLAEIFITIYSRGVDTSDEIKHISLPKNSDFDTRKSFSFDILGTYEQSVNLTIDNNKTAYYVELGLSPNDYSNDVMFSWICFKYTINSL